MVKCSVPFMTWLSSPTARHSTVYSPGRSVCSGMLAAAVACLGSDESLCPSASPCRCNVTAVSFVGSEKCNISSLGAEFKTALSAGIELSRCVWAWATPAIASPHTTLVTSFVFIIKLSLEKIRSINRAQRLREESGKRNSSPHAETQRRRVRRRRGCGPLCRDRRETDRCRRPVCLSVAMA